jgi:hypothetical protein
VIRVRNSFLVAGVAVVASSGAVAASNLYRADDGPDAPELIEVVKDAPVLPALTGTEREVFTGHVSGADALSSVEFSDGATFTFVSSNDKQICLKFVSSGGDEAAGCEERSTVAKGVSYAILYNGHDSGVTDVFGIASDDVSGVLVNGRAAELTNGAWHAAFGGKVDVAIEVAGRDGTTIELSAAGTSVTPAPG